MLPTFKQFKENAQKRYNVVVEQYAHINEIEGFTRNYAIKCITRDLQYYSMLVHNPTLMYSEYKIYLHDVIASNLDSFYTWCLSKHN